IRRRRDIRTDGLDQPIANNDGTAVDGSTANSDDPCIADGVTLRGCTGSPEHPGRKRGEQTKFNFHISVGRSEFLNVYGEDKLKVSKCKEGGQEEGGRCRSFAIQSVRSGK